MRVVLTTFGSLGDLHPYISIALELNRRGHVAVIATSEHYRERIESEGISFEAVRPNIPDLGDSNELMSKVLNRRTGPGFVIREVMMPHLKTSYEDLTRAVSRADFLVNHMLTFAGPLVAEKQGLPWAASVLAPLSFFSAHDPPVLPLIPGLSLIRNYGPRFHQRLFNVMKLSTRSWTKPVRVLRREIGLPGMMRDPLYEGQFSQRLNLALFSSVFAASQPDWPSNTVTTGFPFYDKQNETEEMLPALKHFLDSGEPPIVFTLGSSAVMNAGSFYTESIESALSLGRRAVLLIGGDLRNLPMSPLPAGIAAFEYAPFSKLLPHACAVVHQGGVGTTAQALRAGCPMLVVPFGFDQPDNAQRVARLGVARVLSRSRYNAHSAAKCLNDLLSNPSYRDKSYEVTRIIRTESGANIACDSIETAANCVMK